MFVSVRIGLEQPIACPNRDPVSHCRVKSSGDIHHAWLAPNVKVECISIDWGECIWCEGEQKNEHWINRVIQEMLD